MAEAMVTCPSCKEHVARKGNVVTMGVNAILVCPSCLTETEVSNVGRPSFSWTLATGPVPPVRPPHKPDAG